MLKKEKAHDRDCNIRLRILILFQIFTQVSNLCKSMFVLVYKNKKVVTCIACFLSVVNVVMHDNAK